MASSRGRPASRFQIHSWKESGEVSPQPHRKVPVVYYLTRNGQLEHPHFMEVPLSSPHGLYLRDVIDRLNLLRGRGMTDLYSWSCKRTYKNGFVWHDLGVNDLVYPPRGQEYVILKGSEVLDCAIICKCDENAAAMIARTRPLPRNDYDFPELTRGSRRRNPSWTSEDYIDYYKVYREVEACDPGGGRAATNASTQTEDLRRRRRAITAEGEGIDEDKTKPSLCERQSTELRTEEISVPAAWVSSSETLGSLLKGDCRIVSGGSKEKDGTGYGGASGSGRLRSASSVMQLIWCRDCGVSCFKDEEI